MKPTIEFMKHIIEAFYQLEGNSCGGGLHIVTDDYNVEDHHIEWCISDERSVGEYAYRYTEDVQWLGNLLLQFTEEERYMILCGYIPEAEDYE